MAQTTRRQPTLSRTIRRSLIKAVWGACRDAKVPCTNDEAKLVVRVAASLVRATEGLEGGNQGRWFRIPTYVTDQLDSILPVVFTPMVDTPNAGSLHAVFNAALCSELSGSRGFQLRRPTSYWQIRIVGDDQSLAAEPPVHLEVRQR